MTKDLDTTDDQEATTEQVGDALKEWLRRGGKPNTLMRIALQLPRAKTPLLHALETLS